MLSALSDACGVAERRRVCVGRGEPARAWLLNVYCDHAGAATGAREQQPPQRAVPQGPPVLQSTRRSSPNRGISAAGSSPQECSGHGASAPARRWRRAAVRFAPGVHALECDVVGVVVGRPSIGPADLYVAIPMVGSPRPSTWRRSAVSWPAGSPGSRDGSLAVRRGLRAAPAIQRTSGGDGGASAWPLTARPAAVTSPSTGTSEVSAKYCVIAASAATGSWLKETSAVSSV